MNKREQIQKEATLAILENKFNGLLLVSPRLGKTKLTIDALNTVSKTIKALIMAPKLDILDSWKQEIIKWNLRSNIEITYSWSNSLKKIKDRFHLIIADECHEYNLKVLGLLRIHQINGTRILGLTGTLEDYSKFHLLNILGLKIFYSYTFAQAIEDGIIADYKINCIKLSLDSQEQQEYNKWDNLYKENVNLGKHKSLHFYSSKRIEIIYNSKTKIEETIKFLNKCEERCLIFTGRTNVADQLGEASYHSKSPKDNLEKFKNGEINKLSTVAMISLGITISNLKCVVFNQLKSVESLCIQQAMRSLNLEGDKIANIYIFYLKNTQDETWLKSAIKGFDKSKIKFIENE